MERQFRLTRSTDFKRVRRFGKSYAHPLLVLVALRNDGQAVRVGIAAGKSVGGAVQRNRAKRRLRAAIQNMRDETWIGWDVILIARPPILIAEFPQIQAALRELLLRANILGKDNAS